MGSDIHNSIAVYPGAKADNQLLGILLAQTLLLTATVTPNTTVNVSLTDPAIRLAQYRTAVLDWAETADTVGADLMIVETSGADPDALLKEVPDRLRAAISFVSFSPEAADIPRGKGYLEWQAIGAGIASKSFDPDRTLYKVTGRLRIVNPHKVFGSLKSDAVRVRMRIDGTLADTRVVGAPVSLWHRVLLPAARDVDMLAGIDIEHALGANLIRERNLRRLVIDRFPQRPLFLGESGYNGVRCVPWRTAVKGRVLQPFEPVVAAAARSLGR